jgi:hypothetical protein
VENSRCRLAGLAYTARFEWLLDTMEEDNYFIRPKYTALKRPGTGLRMGLSILSAFIQAGERKPSRQPVISQPLKKS